MTIHACPPVPVELLPLDTPLCVGFGYVEVTKDGERIWQGDDWDTKLHRFEAHASEFPGEWKVEFVGPLSGSVYRRASAGRWERVSTNRGFA